MTGVRSTPRIDTLPSARQFLLPSRTSPISVSVNKFCLSFNISISTNHYLTVISNWRDNIVTCVKEFRCYTFSAAENSEVCSSVLVVAAQSKGCQVGLYWTYTVIHAKLFVVRRGRPTGPDGSWWHTAALQRMPGSSRLPWTGWCCISSNHYHAQVLPKKQTSGCDCSQSFVFSSCFWRWRIRCFAVA